MHDDQIDEQRRCCSQMDTFDVEDLASGQKSMLVSRTSKPLAAFKNGHQLCKILALCLRSSVGIYWKMMRFPVFTSSVVKEVVQFIASAKQRVWSTSERGHKEEAGAVVG